MGIVSHEQELSARTAVNLIRIISASFAPLKSGASVDVTQQMQDSKDHRGESLAIGFPLAMDKGRADVMSLLCPGSVHLRRLGLLAGAVEILVWGLSAKGAVGSVMVVEVSEGIDAFIERLEAMRQVVAGVELVAP